MVAAHLQSSGIELTPATWHLGKMVQQATYTARSLVSMNINNRIEQPAIGKILVPQVTQLKEGL